MTVFLHGLMLSYSKLARKPKIFRSFTGLDVEPFDFLYESIREELAGQSKNACPEEKGEEVGTGRNCKIVWI